MNKKLFKFVLLFALLAIVISACKPAAPAEETKKTLKFGVSAQLVAHDWSIRAWEGIQEEAASRGIEVVQLSAGQDPDKQLADIESLIEQKVDGIIILLGETAVLDQAIKKTTDAGIPVVFMDGGYQADGVIQNISSDNCQFGKDAIDYIAKEKGEDAKIVLQTYPVVEATNLRTVCAKPYMAEKYPNMTILEELPILGPEWTADAQAHAEQMMTKYGDELDAFGVCSDLFAIGSSAAVDSAGLSKQIMVTGVDGLDQIIEKIADPESSMSLTFLQDSKAMGKAAVATLSTYLDAGCTIPMSDKCKDVVPLAQFVPGIMVTKDNAAQYVK